MVSFKRRLFDLIDLIKLKQRVIKAKQLQLRDILANKEQIKHAKKVNFQFQSVGGLFKALITISGSELSTMLLLSLVSLVIQLFSANINTFIIELFQNQQSTINLIKCILILIIYKITKATIDQCSSYLQMNYGFLGYSALYYNFLNGKKQMTGEILNIIEGDMEKICNMPYSLINFPYLSILILVLTIMLACTLNSNIIIFIVISIVLYAVNTVGGIIIFYLNEKVMKQKDYRLGLNLTKYSDPKIIHEARRKEVSLIRNFLMVKVIVKWLIQVSFVVFYGLVFLWNIESTSSQNQLYHRLMLLGMLKVAFNALYIESYYLALVFNSLQRIILCQNRQQIQKSTIGCYEDFIKRKQKVFSKLEVQNERESTDSALCSQRSSIKDSLLQPNLELPRQNKKEMKIKQIKQINLSKPTSPLKKYSQRGQIKILGLLRYIKSNIHWFLILILMTFGLATLFIKFQYLKISKFIMHNSLSPYETLIFISPAFMYLMFYLTIVLLFGEISKNLFKNLNSQQIQGEDLNRISGDIQLVDKYIPPTFYEFFITVFSLFASLILTVSLIKDVYYAIPLSILIFAIIFLAIYLNRYFMKSRRQIKRLECKMKSKIIQTYAEHIQSQSNEEIAFQKIDKNWRKINLMKNIGIVVENSYILVLNFLVLAIQISCFVICYSSSMEPGTVKLILVFILQLDLSLSGLMLNTIGLQMGLVNFERCLNFVKRGDKIKENFKLEQ